MAKAPSYAVSEHLPVHGALLIAFVVFEDMAPLAEVVSNLKLIGRTRERLQQLHQKALRVVIACRIVLLILSRNDILTPHLELLSFLEDLLEG